LRGGLLKSNQRASTTILSIVEPRGTKQTFPFIVWGNKLKAFANKRKESIEAGQRGFGLLEVLVSFAIMAIFA
jgi:prepilin-type N-terminal cleavage/methylation domain-containing protein